MPTRVLAQKLGCTPSNITAMEQREVKGTISLDTLQQVAQTMGCKLFYGFVPIESLDKVLENQATLLARKRIDMINHSMKLEQQGLTKSQLQQQEEALVQELLQVDPKALWKDI
jgi:predicted DNA-binding mobile mystery protein A